MRPLLPTDRLHEVVCVDVFPCANQIVLAKQNCFTVSYALPLNCSQSQLFVTTVYPLINCVLEGDVHIQILLIIKIYIPMIKLYYLCKVTPSQYGCYYLCFCVLPRESVTASYQLILQNSGSGLQKIAIHGEAVICMSILSDCIW